MNVPRIGAVLPVCLAGGLWLVGISCVARAAGDAPALPPISDLPLRIRELEHPDYQVRTRATKAIAEAGAQALDPLKAALKSDNLELRLRVVDLLGRIYSQGDEATFEPAESALEKVRNEAGGSLGAQAEQVLASNFELRQKLAAEQIRKMGGSVLYRPELPGVVTTVESEEDAEGSANSRIVDAVVIGQDWTGGDKGLQQIRRLTMLRVVYRVRKAPVSDEAIDELQKDMQQFSPGFSVESRGSAYFGINPTAHPRGCVIYRVAPGSAAEKAGIQPNDLVTHFGGKPVENPETFIDLIAEKVPGDSVPVSLERGGQTMELKVELTGWPSEAAP